MEQAKPSNPLRALGIFLVFVLIMWWLLNVFNTGNPLWFLPIQPTFTPSTIVIWQNGTAVTLHEGSEGFLELTDALNASFADFKNSAAIDLGISDSTLKDYHEKDFVIEIYYAKPIRFNTAARMQGVTQLLIPINGRHAGSGYVFFGGNGIWFANAMVMSNDQPIMDALTALGYK